MERRLRRFLEEGPCPSLEYSSHSALDQSLSQSMHEGSSRSHSWGRHRTLGRVCHAHTSAPLSPAPPFCLVSGGRGSLLSLPLLQSLHLFPSPSVTFVLKVCTNNMQNLLLICPSIWCPKQPPLFLLLGKETQPICSTATAICATDVPFYLGLFLFLMTPLPSQRLCHNSRSSLSCCFYPKHNTLSSNTTFTDCVCWLSATPHPIAM